MTIEEVIEKVNKLLALAENEAATENEAANAAMAAQKLMAKFNLEQADLQTNKKESKIMIKTFAGGKGYKWRYTLACIIARNFRVKTYIIGRDLVAFYGYEIDVDIALSTFGSLFKIGNKLALKVYYEYKHDGRDTKGAMNTYLTGFMKGIAEKLDEQCKALMIITPKEVNEKYAEYSKNFGTLDNTLRQSFDRELYERGRMDGKLSFNSRSIEA